MDYSTFLDLLSKDTVPKELDVYLQALWWDARGNWERAHGLIQDLPDTKAARIHAYLHRKEGDLWNADYWYARAGAIRPAEPLNTEAKGLIEDLLAG
ncbi:hypothetical protein [Olivibacter sitiensis]|uniref:hypothetical protein n=1 Tax=Olivibacter sitiensis TaxID=376470 RepID=UPI000425A771|nr:hypothetical protein [Olivibacter sitiensis]